MGEKMKKVILSALLVFFMPLVNVHAEAISFKKQKTNEEMCQEIWEPLWSAVQTGEVAPRFGIVMSMVTGSLKGVPSHSNDYFSRRRDMLILAIHSVGMIELDYKFIDTLYYKHLKGVPGDRAFFQCIETKRSQNCAQILVDHKTIPPIQDFIDEIEAAIEDGAKPKCKFPEAYDVDLRLLEKAPLLEKKQKGLEE
jgi:hypothetical protein